MNEQLNTINLQHSVHSPLNNIEQSIDPLQDGISSIELVRVSGSDVDIVNAARVSYGKCTNAITERDVKLIQFLIEHQHTSPFEHNQFSFRVKAPVFVGRQWMRHRISSYNEISYRYTQAPLEFYIPPKWRYQDTKNKQASFGAFDNQEMMELYMQGIETSRKSYEALLEKGLCRELARCVLPLSTYTQFIYTCNLLALMHFLKLRLHAGAQYEIQMFAKAMLQLAAPHFPIAFSEWKKFNKDRLNITEDDFTPNFTRVVD